MASDLAQVAICHPANHDFKFGCVFELEARMNFLAMNRNGARRNKSETYAIALNDQNRYLDIRADHNSFTDLSALEPIPKLVFEARASFG